MSRIKLVVSLFFLIGLLIGLLLGSNSFSFIKNKRGESVKILEINSEKILVENYSGEKTEVTIPIKIKDMIDRENDYFVEYEYFYWGGKRNLISIEPVE